MSIFDSDWFKRNENYVVKDDTASIGWDIKDGEYTRFLYSPSVCSSIVRNKQLLLVELNDLLVSMNLHNKVRCITNDQDESYTDGKTIVVSRNINEKSDFKKLDIIFGNTLHECSHCIYTDFSAVIVPSTHEQEIEKHIQNILEDEVIEEKLSSKYNGYANYLGATKHYYFDSAINNLIENPRINELDTILTLFLLTIRFPEKIKEYVSTLENKEKIESIFNEIHLCLTNNDILNINTHYSVTHKTAKTAKEIVKILKEYIGDFKKESDECTGNCSSELRKFSEAMNKCSSSGDTAFSNDQFSKLIQKAIDRFEQDDEELEAEKNIINESFIKDMQFSSYDLKNKHKYETIKKKSYGLIRLMKECVVNNDKKERLNVIHDMRNGTLNNRKIVEAYQEVKNIYDRRTIDYETNKQAKYALLILIDESGSMHNVKEECSTLVISMTEAMKEFQMIDLFVYGHGDEITAYLDHKHKNKYVLGNIRSQIDQDEAVSYEKVLKKVHSMTNLPVITISITDSYYITDFEALKNVLNNYKKIGDSFNLIRLVEQDYDYYGESGVNINNELYGEGKWVSIDIRQPNSMNEAIKKLAFLMNKNFKRI